MNRGKRGQREKMSTGVPQSEEERIREMVRFTV